ncbi:MAG: hypothetical protein GTO45_23100 [Candidatus Aminicenantes bacterium]|nr:hypothetical protein [Candidatus Aminicenantes bacterium]NIM81652.1 hypothetical protein [Candidatus Aminicenantes bacterium]NIN21022.1 hypothetical protein [Candidatus Aminicenantes bacterium]NIN44843.1 hypothetical protein [Candidatus Aminicenantes bacterium]NIN87651.1 hypothetical protein [Candidatus Aminicenantes bacterium]
MKQVIFAIIIFSVIILISCSSNTGNPSVIVIDNVKIREIEVDVIDQKMVFGYLRGVNFERSEVYIEGLIPEDNKYVIRLLDVYTGEEKNKIRLQMGDFQSPGDFAMPVYIQFLDEKYFILDGVFKIVVFDNNFNYLFTSMFQQHRYFLDFYSHGENIYFLLGKKMHLEKEYRCRTELYEVVRNRRPAFARKLHECRHQPAYVRDGRKYYHVGYFWATSWGFEKDGNIFYSDSGENKYYRYNLDTKEKAVFELPFLKAKKYSNEDAEKMSQYKDTGWSKKMRRKVVYIPGSDAIFHFGLYDVGKGKIGIVGEIDADQMRLRLDILGQENGHYNGSIRLPFGKTFIIRNSTEDLGYYYSYFDLDRGIYIWGDLEGEGLDNAVKITKFEIKKEKE